MVAGRGQESGGGALQGYASFIEEPSSISKVSELFADYGPIAGKGRSGTIACSYLISHCGWEPSAAMARFTERRMRAGFGQGISIPSQVRWVHYVDQWTRMGKKYVERSVEVVEVHVWGLREGVKVAVEGYVDEGRGIKTFHVFDADERIIVPNDEDQEDEEEDDGDSEEKDLKGLQVRKSLQLSSTTSVHLVPTAAGGEDTNRKLSLPTSPTLQPSSKTMPAAIDTSTLVLTEKNKEQEKEKEKEKEKWPPGTEPGGMAVLFRPRPGKRIILPTNDVNLALERRTPISSRGPSSWQMVTAVAHVWFNTFFEGTNRSSEPETPQDPPKAEGDEEKISSTVTNDASLDGKDEKQETAVNDSGVFEINWEAMDGIKGTSKRGTRALDRMAVVWKVVTPGDDSQSGAGTGISSKEAIKGHLRSLSKTRHKKQVSLGKLFTAPLNDTKGSSTSSASTTAPTSSSATTAITPVITTSPPGSTEPTTSAIPQIIPTTAVSPYTTITDVKSNDTTANLPPTTITITNTTNTSIHASPTTLTNPTAISTPTTLPTAPATNVKTNTSPAEHQPQHPETDDLTTLIHSPKSILEPSAKDIVIEDNPPADLKGYGGSVKEAGDHGLNRDLGIKKEKSSSSTTSSLSSAAAGAKGSHSDTTQR